MSKTTKDLKRVMEKRRVDTLDQMRKEFPRIKRLPISRYLTTEQLEEMIEEILFEKM